MVHEHINKISKRDEDTHKGNYGHVFVLAGSRGMTGAAFFASQGALFSGSGLVTNGIPESLNQIMEIKLSEVMTLPLEETDAVSLSLESKEKILSFSNKCDVVAIGPGLSRNQDTQNLVKQLLEEIEKPIVLDADGINALEGNVDILKNRTGSMVLTPHPGEMARLLGKESDEVQSSRVEIAKNLAEVTSCVVCLKGHSTVVVNPEGRTYINDTGNSGMATGGTGDVLTGMIASFIGQGIDDFSATVIAVYLHGLAGDIAVEDLSPFCMTATDILDYLPEAFEKIGL